MTEVISNIIESIEPEFNLVAEIDRTREELERHQLALEGITNQDGEIAEGNLFEISTVTARIDQAERRLAFLQDSQHVLERVQNQDASVAIAGLFELTNTMARVDQAKRRLEFLQGGSAITNSDI